MTASKRVIFDHAKTIAYTDLAAAYLAGVNLDSAEEVFTDRKVDSEGVVFLAKDAAGDKAASSDPSDLSAWAKGRQGVVISAFDLAA